MTETSSLPLAEVVTRAERLVALSPADATSVAWIERSRHLATEGARGRRAESAPGREVIVRVRLSGRTGQARTDAAGASELQQAMREALAVARAAEPSPEWDLAALGDEPERLEGLVDADLGELELAAAAALLERLAEKRATLALRWSDVSVAVVGSHHAARAARATEVTLEARTGRRPGSGFAAASARWLGTLDPEAVMARARALEASATLEWEPRAAVPVVLAPEAAAALVEAWSRRAFSGRRALGSPRAGAPSGPATLSPLFDLADDPLEPAGLPFPFDLDGVAKRGRTLVAAGVPGGPALDLELAARAGAAPTGNGFATDDAWPQHPRVVAGTAAESALLAAAEGGLRIGALERLVIGDEPPHPFSALARSVRRIEAGGALGAAVAPLVWRGTCAALLGALESRGSDLVWWSPRPHDGLAVSAAPALRFAALDGFQPRAAER